MQALRTPECNPAALVQEAMPKVSRRPVLKKKGDTGPRGFAQRFKKTSIKIKINLLLLNRLTLSLTMPIQRARTPLVGHGL